MYLALIQTTHSVESEQNKMTTINTNQLQQLRASILSQNSALQKASGGAPRQSEEVGSATDFSKAMVTALNAVNDQQTAASNITDAYQKGDTNDIVQVMVERQKASLGFEATLQVRNKLLSAYRDIMNMPV
jgi:flagellar hook-basal body complex protein FliE